MHGVSKITSAENVMLISYSDADAPFMVKVLNDLAMAGVVVDMISQTAPSGKNFRFSFTASSQHFDTTIKVIGGEKKGAPMVSVGYAKIYLFGKEMVESVGVAARALDALADDGVDIALITTSDLDISLLLRQEDADVAMDLLKKAFAL